MYIDLLGYRIYWTFFVLIIVLTLLVFIGIRVFSYRREAKAVYTLSVITEWQKNNIPSILRGRLGQSIDEDNILRLCNYIEQNKYWNDEEMLEISEDVVIDATFLLFNEIGELLEDLNLVNRNRAILILVTIDFMNGALDLSEGKISEWMDEALPGSDPTGYSSPEKAMQLFTSTIDRAGSQYVDMDLNRIPLTAHAFSPLRNMEVDVLGDAIDDVSDAEKLSNCSEKTRDVIAYCLYDQILELLHQYDGDTVNNYYSSYIRALAVDLNNEDYPNIIDSLA